MTTPGDDPPLEFIWYSLEEALRLLSGLEAAGRTLIESGHLAGAVLLDEEIRVLRRKLDDEIESGGDTGGR